jgi:hypothetical protein
VEVVDVEASEAAGVVEPVETTLVIVSEKSSGPSAVFSGQGIVLGGREIALAFIFVRAVIGFHPRSGDITVTGRFYTRHLAQAPSKQRRTDTSRQSLVKQEQE